MMQDWDNFISDDEDDKDVNEDEEARRIRNNRVKKALKGKGKERAEGSGSGRPFGTTGAPAAPPEGWPANVELPTNSVVALAEQWFDFVPRGRREANTILTAARQGDTGATIRVRDLITQAQRDAVLRAVEEIGRAHV